MLSRELSLFIISIFNAPKPKNARGGSLRYTFAPYVFTGNAVFKIEVRMVNYDN